ncbi:zf-DNL-domain-containing protein [Stereum hirsutum FP-91666 SS1]|uniref:zf-DNL-domain-containing protein n=1 Tax=Stereum hirsutum (strain FP-91666) TaxID=721885 RepID=UPI000440F1EF|nr:zf-DNL-domain-containing protein [Stereum hirsutum FP-91666 SS1]EIM86554.1 zf-DNL-domain-containing protein [Stereum hirsutum FP-91666 SS1]
MLPTRLFRNTGIAPPLRTLLTPSSSLPSTLSTQLRLRLAVNPASASTITTSACAHSPQAQVQSHQHDHHHSHAYPGDVASSTHIHGQEHPYVRQEPTLSLTFTCTADECNTRSTHQFSKRSYTTGIVLIECPGCKNRHLIADHLGWFQDGTQNGQYKTVEDLVRSRGEKVKYGKMDTSGSIEYSPA